MHCPQIYLIMQLLFFGCCLELHKDDKKLKFFDLKKNQDVIHADITSANTIQALEKISFYYFKHKKEANVDFAFGMRAAEGEIARILHMSDLGSYPGVNEKPEEKKRLSNLLESIQSNMKQSLPYIELKNKEYFTNFYPLIKDKWTSLQFPPQYSVRDITVFPNTTIENDFEEEDSDKCMVDLMNPNNKCQFEKCWDKMAKMGTSRYYNTHQLLWFLLGDKLGCSDAMNKKAQEQGYKNGITDIVEKKCAGAIIEMEAITKDGYRKGMVDLFLEQGFICGSIGFMDAVRPQWLKLALQWQDPTLGCFLESLAEDYDEESFKFWVNFKREEWKSRRLFADYENNDGCSTHTTAVAAGFFATYLRLFYDPFYKKSQLDTYLYPVPVEASPSAYTILSALKIAAFIVIAFVVIIIEFKRRLILRVYGFFVRCFFKFKRVQTTRKLPTNFV